jgi:Domain of unknown function (DUF4262)
MKRKLRLGNQSNRQCRCRLCAPVQGYVLDEREQHFVDVVGRHGWMVTNIKPQDQLPGWAFTTGLTHSFGSPDLVMTGLGAEVLHTSLNIVGEAVRNGSTLEPGRAVPDVLEGYDVTLRPVDTGWHSSMFGWTRWFAQQDEPRFLHLVWPDKAGCFPGDASFDPRIARLQPDLSIAPRSHGPGPWRAWAADSAWPGRRRSNGLVFASRKIVESGAPVLGVSADLDGDWSFTDGAIVESSEQIVLTHLYHLILDDPTLEEQIALEPGHSAWRSTVGGEWTINLHDDNDE